MKPDPDFDSLVLALLDGTISKASHRQLEEWLSTDHNDRQRYLELVELHDLLEQVAEESQSGNPQTMVSIRSRMRKEGNRFIMWCSLAAAAVVALSVLVLQKGSFLREAGHAVTISTSPHSIYTISRSAVASGVASKVAMDPGDSLILRQGTVGLRFASGAISVLQAPASVNLLTADQLVIREGRGWFQVPQSAVGFRVSTDQIQVKNSGTEFGIVADRILPSISDQVHVFKGKVESATLYGSMQPEIVAAGQARTVLSTGRLVPVGVAPDLFLRSLPPDLTYLHWSFDGTHPLAIGGDDPASVSILSSLTSNRFTLGPGRIDQAFRFAPGGAHIRTTWRGIDAHRPRTIVAWIKCPPQSPDGAIVEWGIPQTNSSKWRLSLNPELFNEGGIRGALRTEFGYGYVIGTTDLRDDRWHHIASVYDGNVNGGPDSIQLFVDGHRETLSAFQENQVETVVNHRTSAPCEIGNQFNGWIDELRIYEGTLPASAILELSKLPAVK